MGLEWSCPFCGLAQVAVPDRRFSQHVHIRQEDSAQKEFGVLVSSIICANVQCKELSLSVRFGPDFLQNTASQVVRRLTLDGSHTISLRPRGTAKPLPDYIPEAIRSDYEEACLIADLSPKASATLARRCLQGMIRHFTGVKPGRLVDEIDRLAAAIEAGTAPRYVSQDSVDALTAVRHMGNFGAHMEKDVDVIVPVEPEEASELLRLIESLFADWYVERHAREQRFAKVTAMAAEKKAFAAGQP